MTSLLGNYNECIIEQATIVTNDERKFDIFPYITGYGISESIESSALHGWVTIIDTVGVLEKIPLMGEETLLFSLRGLDFDTEKKIVGFVYKINDVRALENSSGTAYTLHFVTKMSFLSSARIVTASFNEPVHDIVMNVFDQTYDKIKKVDVFEDETNEFDLSDGRKLVIERTQDNLRCLIPTYTPSETLYFLSSRAYSDLSPSCMFRFFETTSGYNFVTDEWLIKNAIEKDLIKSVEWSQSVTIGPSEIEKQRYKLTKFHNDLRVDTANDLYSGGYASSAIIIDFLQKKVENFQFKYVNDAEFTSTKGTREKNLRHSREFVNSVFNDENERKILIFKDYDSRGEAQLKGDEKIPQIALRKMSYDHMIMSTSMNASMSGRLDISAGDVLNVKIPELQTTDEREENFQLSGNFLVHSVIHTVEGRELKTDMKLIKFGWERSV